MNIYYLKMLFVVFISSILIGCTNERMDLNGYFTKSESPYRNTSFKQIIFSDTNTVLIDEEGLSYYYNNYNNYKKSKILSLENKGDTLNFPIRIFKDSIRIEDAIFKRKVQTQKVDTLSIELAGIKSKIIHSNYQASYRKYVLKIDNNEYNEPFIILGDKNAKLEEIPLFLQCPHCKGATEVIILIDKNIQYSKLIEIYYWLSISGVGKAGIVTNAEHLNQYEGFFDRIHFWEEEMIKFQRDKDSPPSPPIQSKANFIGNADNVEYLKGMNSSKIESFIKKFDSNSSYVLVSFDKRIKIKEYTQTMLEMRKHISSRRNEKSLKIYKTEFENLNTNSKKIITKTFPFVIIERN